MPADNLAHLPTSRRKPNALVAAARRVTMPRSGVRGARGDGGDGWQSQAWDHYTNTGEVHYVATVVARGVSRAKLIASHDPEGADEPTPLAGESIESPTDQLAADLVADLGGSRAGQAQLLERLAVNLFVAGEAYVLAVEEIDGVPAPGELGAVHTWHVLSSSEVSSTSTKRLKVTINGEAHELDPDDVLLVRVWQPHPLHLNQPDSPVRSVLRPLDELRSLEAHVAAAVSSRLAGAGILLMPNSVSFAQSAQQTGTELEEDSDPFLVELVETMSEALEDRSSASAVVPIVVRVPDEVASAGITHLTFTTPLDAEARELREEAIRRIALGLDVPPEVLTGLSSSTNWSAWLVQDETVRLTLEPMLGTIADALTVGFLRPSLEALGVPAVEASRYSVWFDSGELRPNLNQSGDAQQLFDRGAITADALRRAHGYSSEDAPEDQAVDAAVSTALELIVAAPSLVQSPGLPALVAQLRAVLEGGAAPAPPGEELEESTPDVVDGQLPETAGEVDELEEPELDA